MSEESPFWEIFNENERDIDFDDFIEPINAAIEKQVDFYMRLKDPSNDEFDELDGVDGFDRSNPLNALNTIMQMTKSMEEDICLNFALAGFDDEETQTAWKVFLTTVKSTCREL